MKNLSTLTIALALIATSCNTSTAPWEDLFNGKDLSGWTQKNGEAIYTVEGKTIVGTTVLNTPNSFLCTEKTYGDFILEFEVIVDEKLNSGVQIRSESYPEYRDGRVHGYQAEIDASEGAWSGGIYDEARIGNWLYPRELNPDAAGAIKKDTWNSYRIECIGDNIKTWINGIAVSNLYDDMTAEGFIALQVHDVGNDPEKEGITVKWRNLKIITEDVQKYAKESTAPVYNRMEDEDAKKLD